MFFPVTQPTLNFAVNNANPDTYCEQRQPREDRGGSADGSDHHRPPLGEGDGQCYFEITPGCVQLRKINIYVKKQSEIREIYLEGKTMQVNSTP